MAGRGGNGTPIGHKERAGAVARGGGEYEATMTNHHLYLSWYGT